MFPASPGHTCVFWQCTHSARTVHTQCTATVHGLETLQIPQKMAPRLQNKEKTCFRIFYLISCHFNRWRVIYSIYSACTAACTVACTVRALYVHCQNTRARHAPPSCSSIGCWNTLVSLGAVLCLPLLFAFGELVCPQLEHLCEPWCFAAACALASLFARSWNILVSLGALLAEYG